MCCDSVQCAFCAQILWLHRVTKRFRLHWTLTHLAAHSLITSSYRKFWLRFSHILTTILATADWTMFLYHRTYIGSCHVYSIIYTIFSSACCIELLSKRLKMAQPESCWMLVRAHLCYAQLNAADVVVDTFILFGFYNQFHAKSNPLYVLCMVFLLLDSRLWCDFTLLWLFVHFIDHFFYMKTSDVLFLVYLLKHLKVP